MKKLIFALLLLPCMLSAQFQQPGGGVIMYDNAEQLPKTGWGIDFREGYAMVTGGSQQVNNPDPRANITLSSTYARKGTKSYRMYVEKRTDYPGCCQWVRSEVMWMSPSQQTTENVWNWGSVSTLIDPAWQFENRPTLIAFDTKSSPDDYITPFGIEIRGDRYIVGVYNNGGENIKYDVGQVEKGVWVDWVVHRNWENNSSGFLRVYKNGSLVVNHSGPNYRRNSYDAPVARIQHGLYKWVWSTSDGTGWGEGVPYAAAQAPIIAYYDEIRFGGPNADSTMFFLDASPATNQPPTANAGDNQSITLPTSSADFTGSGSDPDGIIETISWTKVSGPSGGTITNGTTYNMTVTGLTNSGTYVYRLTVTDDEGSSASDEVTLVVNPETPPSNTLPYIVDATGEPYSNPDVYVQLPITGDTITWHAKDDDQWMTTMHMLLISGPNTPTVNWYEQGNYGDYHLNYVKTSITGLVEGTYVFQMVGTDFEGGVVRDTISIFVIASTNEAPSVDAGSDKIIAYPSTSVQIAATATDSDGSVASVIWEKVSGPDGGSFSASTSTTTTVNNLMPGSYIFRLTATDNQGKTGYDEISVYVVQVSAGADTTIISPETSLTLRGSASDDVSPTLSWTKVSGTGGTIVSSTALSTSVTGLSEGTYVFKLTATYSGGITSSDEVRVTVQAASVIRYYKIRAGQ